MRADAAVRKIFPGLTRRQVEEAFDMDLVLYHGRRLDKGSDIDDTHLDVQPLRSFLEKLFEGTAVDKVDVVAEEKGFLVIHKPPGVPSVPIRLGDTHTVTAWARFHFPEVNAYFDAFQPELAAHRLDTDTEGLLVVCLAPESYNSWRQVFSEHLVEKEYIAWVWGKPDWKNFHLQTSFLIRPGKAKVLLRQDGDESLPPQFAESICTVLKTEGEISQVHVRTSSGMRHQVRAQLAYAGYPLVGDKLYDDKFEDRPFQHSHHLLWASSLRTTKYHWTLLPPEEWGPVVKG